MMPARGERGVRWSSQRSAGGVVMRRQDAGVLFLAVRPRASDRWQLPKGLIEPGEAAERAAIREVREEGGVDAEILSGLKPIGYFYRSGTRGFRKEVTFYAMRYVDGDPKDHAHEVGDACWLPASDVERLAFENERAAVREAVDRHGRELPSG